MKKIKIPDSLQVIFATVFIVGITFLTMYYFGVDSKSVTYFNYYCPGCHKCLHMRPDMLHNCPDCSYQFVLYKEEIE